MIPYFALPDPSILPCTHTIADQEFTMDQALQQWLADGNENAIDEAFFGDSCPHFFAVDWREDDADIVQSCAECIGDDALRAEWRDDSLIIIRGDNETIVPLAHDEGDRDVTIRKLNDILQPAFEIRFLVCSHGNDTAGFAVLPAIDWQLLESDLSESARANFIKLAALPNLFTEMTDQHLSETAHARFQRMLDRN